MADGETCVRSRGAAHAFRMLFLLSLVRQPMTTDGMTLLLSDLPTPSLVLDLQALQRLVSTENIPSISLSAADEKLHPSVVGANDPTSSKGADRSAEMMLSDLDAEDGIFYLHSRVDRSREEVSSDDEPTSTFLAEIDLPPRLCGAMDFTDDNRISPAHLVLGLNNHHVGSYYWARSVGTGASMEAPGVLFDASNDTKGRLRWEEEGGPTECNSNDGKRSEWVNFLRPGDNVQLLPLDPEKAIAAFLDEFASTDSETSRIFGVTSKGRPLGSEPEVVCEWKL